MIRFIQKEYSKADEELLNTVLRNMLEEEKELARKNSGKSGEEQKRLRRKYFENTPKEQVEKYNKKLDKELKRRGVKKDPNPELLPIEPKPAPKPKAPGSVKEKVEEKVKETVKKRKKSINKKTLGLTTAGIIGTSGAFYGAKKYKEHRQKEQSRYNYRKQLGLVD